MGKLAAIFLIIAASCGAALGGGLASASASAPTAIERSDEGCSGGEDDNGGGCEDEGGCSGDGGSGDHGGGNPCGGECGGGGGGGGTDSDGDGIRDCDDNCVIDVNPEQADADADGVGDVCELARPSQLEVVAYNDRDGNGSRGGGEPAIADWSYEVVQIVEGVPQGEPLILTTGRTSGHGYSSSVLLPPGDYQVCEASAPPAPWTHGNPATPCTTVTVVADGLARASFGYRAVCPSPSPSATPSPSPSATASPSPSSTPSAAPTARPEPTSRPVIDGGTLRISAYLDRDRDGVRGSDDVPLPAWSFRVYAGTTLVASLVTDADGVTAAGLLAGTYSVTGSTRARWASTDPAGADATKVATVSPGETTVVSFGFAIAPILPPTSQTQLAILAYVDTDRDGSRGVGEPLGAGFNFTISDAAGVTLATVITAGAGSATLTGFPLGTYTVTSDPPAGWLRTEPGRAPSVTATLSEATPDVVVVFGYAPIALPSTSTVDDRARDTLIVLYVYVCVALGASLLAPRPTRRGGIPHV